MTLEWPNRLEIGSHSLPLVVRSNRRAKRICLRYNATDHAVNLTLPQRTELEDGLQFLQTKYDWLESTLNEAPPKKHLKPGVKVPILGEPFRLRHQTDLPGTFALKDGMLLIGGTREHTARRTQDALKQIIRNEITGLAPLMAKQLNRKVGRISIRDTRTRWGSCSSTGNLNFCWRLVFAPREGLEYVVAHEVAHLKHMDHSPRFWATVEQLLPNYQGAKEWLRLNASELCKYHVA